MGKKSFLLSSIGIGALIVIVILGIVLSFFLLQSIISSVIEDDSSSDNPNANVGILNDGGGVQHVDLINEKASEYNVDPALLAAVMKQESGFKSNNTSSAGALGLMQIMPANCKGYGYTIEECKKDENNVDIGAQMIAGHLDDYDGDLKLALAAYNAGVGNVQKYDGVPPFEETQNYVDVIPDYYDDFKDQVEDGEIEKDDSFEGKGSGEFSMPIKNGGDHISSPFGMRWGKLHAGIDISRPKGTTIHASDDGKVVRSKTNPGGYGYYIDVKHKGGWITRYGHMTQDTVVVDKGDKVKQGDKLAEVGTNGHSTGYHLHFEIHNPDGNPVDPLKLL